ncbi:molecular chaperone [Acinetobacter sp. ACIN00229]|uniref:fimbrial biogenesis chaperone n=1 Tax=Acinetobacter sp. ACIN00229 TaxID=2792607 RepID=UPI001D0EFDE4|nr:molecular chaperone [Acinetobacter sp. ACIN00229]
MNIFLDLFQKFLLLVIYFLNLSFRFNSFASVVRVGTRVILEDSQTEKTIYFQNKDNKPALVQIWLDENCTLDATKAPFVITPQIFRMEANTSQIVRLRYTGELVSNSQESLYYLNFIQYPSNKQSEIENNNHLMVVFKNRIKVFFRPKELSDFMSSSIVIDKLGFLIDPADKKLTINNPTPYFSNIQEIGLQINGKYFILKKILLLNQNQLHVLL